MAQIRIRYKGPVALAHMLGSMIQDEGLEDVQYEGRMLESRGAQQAIEQIALLIGFPVLSNAAYDLAKAGVQRALTKFKDRHPGIEVEIEQDDPGDEDNGSGL
jgi:hypothetical protein